MYLILFLATSDKDVLVFSTSKSKGNLAKSTNSQILLIKKLNHNLN